MTNLDSIFKSRDTTKDRLVKAMVFPVAEEAVPGPSVFPSGEPGVSGGTFGGRRKAVRDRFALQGGTGDFP